MRWHCGLLSERPDRDRTLQWVKRGGWGTGLPDDIQEELEIFLAMPGFSISYLCHVFRTSRHCVLPHLGGFEARKAQVIENWMSVTREDAVKLSQLRPNAGSIPVISQLFIMDDAKAGRPAGEVAKEYRTNTVTVTRLRRGLLRSRHQLPAGFDLI